MEIALIILSLALVVCLYLLIFKPGSPPASKIAPNPPKEVAENNKPPPASQQEALLAKTAELQKAKAELQKTKEELKQSKQKLFEAREKNKLLETELKTQKQLERLALQETENARLSLADVSTELHKLKLELETQKPSSKTAAPSAAPPPPPAATESAKPAKRMRELNPAEKEKLENAERSIAAEHNRAQELEKELKNLKIRLELGQRQLKTSHASSKLQKDKFRALEKRLNRTLLERDFILRAMRDLENRCGLQAAIPELPKEAFSGEETENASEFSPNPEEAEKTED